MHGVFALAAKRETRFRYEQKGEPTMTRLLIPAIVAALLSPSPVFAQTGSAAAGSPSAPSPLGATSPLGVGPGSPVPPTGLSMGATELGSRGVSPLTSGASPATPGTAANSGNSAPCLGFGGSLPQASFG